MADPISIGGCTLWLEADVGVYHDAGTTLCTNGQTVAQWNDQSGNGHNAVVGAHSPFSYFTGVVNSLPAIDASINGAGGAGMDISMSAIAAPYTIFVVYQPQAAIGSGNGRAIQGASNNWLIGPRGGFNTCFGVSGFVSTGVGPAVVAGTTARMYTTNSGSASTFVIEGTDHTTGGSNVGAPGIPALGNGGSTNEALGGHLCEVVIYNSVLSPTNLGLVDSYLYAKWEAAASALFRRTLYDRVGSRGVQ